MFTALLFCRKYFPIWIISDTVHNLYEKNSLMDFWKTNTLTPYNGIHRCCIVITVFTPNPLSQHNSHINAPPNRKMSHNFTKCSTASGHASWWNPLPFWPRDELPRHHPWPQVSAMMIVLVLLFMTLVLLFMRVWASQLYFIFSLWTED